MAKIAWQGLCAGAVMAAAAMLGAVGAAPIAPAPAAAGCARSVGASEHAICADPALAALDRQLAGAYQQRLAADPAVRPIERGWLAARDEGCGRARACLRRFMSAHLVWLHGRAPMSVGRPTREGACNVSAMKEVTSRLEGVADSGTAVVEANGAVQVWYEEVPEAAQSRVRDPTLVCLVSIPRGCPRGDDRGRVYAVANLRTFGAWSGPDAEHMCGGA